MSNTTVLKKCSICKNNKPHAKYSDKQWAKNKSATDRKCMACVAELLNSGTSLTASLILPHESNPSDELEEEIRENAKVVKKLFAQGVLVHATPEEVAREKPKFQQPLSFQELVALSDEVANKLANGQPVTVYPESILL